MDARVRVSPYLKSAWLRLVVGSWPGAMGTDPNAAA
jgi:hypothetical protein